MTEQEDLPQASVLLRHISQEIYVNLLMKGFFCCYLQVLTGHTNVCIIHKVGSKINGIKQWKVSNN